MFRNGARSLMNLTGKVRKMVKEINEGIRKGREKYKYE